MPITGIAAQRYKMRVKTIPEAAPLADPAPSAHRLRQRGAGMKAWSGDSGMRKHQPADRCMVQRVRAVPMPRDHQHRRHEEMQPTTIKHAQKHAAQ